MSVVHCFTYGTMMAIGIWALGSVMALHLRLTNTIYSVNFTECC